MPKQTQEITERQPAQRVHEDSYPTRISRMVVGDSIAVSKTLDPTAIDVEKLRAVKSSLHSTLYHSAQRALPRMADDLPEGAPAIGIERFQFDRGDFRSDDSLIAVVTITRLK